MKEYIIYESIIQYYNGYTRYKPHQFQAKTKSQVSKVLSLYHA
jgi:hypothetical protein